MKFITLILVRTLGNTYGLKCMRLPFQINIDKGILEHDMNLDNNG